MKVLRLAFRPDEWRILLRVADYTAPRRDVTPAVVQTRTAAIHHEARHAEQFFLAARLIRGRRFKMLWGAHKQTVASVMRGNAIWDRARGRRLEEIEAAIGA